MLCCWDTIGSMSNTTFSLSRPVVYSPFDNGVYKVSAGLSKLKKEKTLEIDCDFHVYRAIKKQSQYSYMEIEGGMDPNFRQRLCSLIKAKLLYSYPEYFVNKGSKFVCLLTGTVLDSSNDETENLHALSYEIQEDIAVVKKYSETDRLDCLAVYNPSGWNPKEKLGKNFVEVHNPVADIEKLNSNSSYYIDIMIHAVKGLVRFVWSCNTERVLVERQCIIGIPDYSAALFTIHPYYYNYSQFYKTQLYKLSLAIKGMSQDSLKYKNMKNSEEILSVIYNYMD